MANPVVTSFIVPPTWGSLLVPITTFTATASTSVNGWMVTSTNVAPLDSDPRWSDFVLKYYNVGSAGTKTLRAWVKDTLGNISTAVTATVVVSLVSADFYFVLNYPAQLSRKPAVITYKFGDGYEQRVSPGLNVNLQSWSLKASSLDLEEATDIDLFLSEKNGITSFTWYNPMDVLINVVCSEWNIDFDEDNAFTATFREVPA